MNDFFNVTMTGEETLQADLNDSLKAMLKPIKAGLTFVADDMVQSLRAHIEDDVYNAYEPKSYPRRRDNSRFGKGLASSEYIHSSVESLRLTFAYEPMGYHSGRMQDALDAYEEAPNGSIRPTSRTKAMWNKPLKPKPVHGDALIQRIQTGEGYDWKSPKADPDNPNSVDSPGWIKRPFWDNFVNEQKYTAFGAFERGFKSSATDVNLVAEGHFMDIEWGATEGMLDSHSMVNDFTDVFEPDFD